MENEKRPADTATVLFADVCGSVGIYDRLGNDRALEVIGERLTFLSEIVAEFSGRIVKTIGDELMCLFPDAAQAAKAGAQMLARLKAWPANLSEPITFKIGMHSGEVIRRGTDVFGDTVNLAARMVSLAGDSQLILTGEMVDQLPEEIRFSCRLVGPIYVKGKNEPVTVHELVWEGRDDTETLIAPAKSLLGRVNRRLRLRAGEHVYRMDAEQPTLRIGRADDNDLVADSPHASRHHMVIERRGDKFVLTDRSTNGTYVGSVLDDSGQRVHRDQLLLVGRGWLGLGEQSPDESHRIHYEVD